MEPRPPRPIGAVVGTGTLAGLIAGFAAGMIDAVWSWAPAAQFVPSIGGRLRFVIYTAISHGTAGAAVGLALAAWLLVLSRATRLGDLARFAWTDHAARRARDPRQAIVGLSLALVKVPIVATSMYVAYRMLSPFLAERHVPKLVIIVSMAGAIGAIGAATVLIFLVGRLVEWPLGKLAARVRVVSSVWMPFAVVGVELGVLLALWAHAEWEVARVLPLRGPIVAVVAAVLAIPALGPARRAIAPLAIFRWRIRFAVWLAVASVLPIAMLASGGSAAVIKASSAYTGLGGPIARIVRTAFDRDGDGYSRFLGGGDCDDSDPYVHPGAPEIPDNGIDDNCVGGDATAKHSIDDVGFTAVPPSVPAGFNILLITIDTTRADHLGTYHYQRDTSPNLDKLGAEGTVFENGWAHAPSTRYSMPAILTGRLPLDVYYDNSTWWPGILLKATTLAESLAALGFVTGAITNYEYFDRKRHMDQGFAEYDNEDAQLHAQLPGKGPEETRGSSSKEQSDKAIAFVTRHAADRWFLWVHYYDPHYSYEPHAEVPSFGTDRVALYDGEIRFTDMHIGRVLDDLRVKGLYDKTVVVVTGDHGEGFGEHRIDLHGYDLYSPQTKVPLIVRVPGLAPRRATTPAAHVDLMPTLVNLAGGAATTEMMGHSLVDVIAGAEHPDRVVFQQLSYEGNHEKRGGVSRTCHVLYNVSPDTSWEVYDLAKDPLETEDKAGDDDVCRETRAAVERWYDASQVPAGAARALLQERPAIATPLADLGTSVRLLSVDAPAKAHPGEQITLTWTFQSLGRVAPGWIVFCHIEAPNHVVTNGDHQPDLPLESWRKDQFIRYTTTMALPPGGAGKYTVWAGLWRGQTQKRVHVAGAHARVDNDAVAVATIEVAP